MPIKSVGKVLVINGDTERLKKFLKGSFYRVKAKKFLVKL